MVEVVYLAAFEHETVPLMSFHYISESYPNQYPRLVQSYLKIYECYKPKKASKEIVFY